LAQQARVDEAAGVSLPGGEELSNERVHEAKLV